MTTDHQAQVEAAREECKRLLRCYADLKEHALSSLPEVRESRQLADAAIDRLAALASHQADAGLETIVCVNCGNTAWRHAALASAPPAPAASEPVGHHVPSEPVQEPIYLIFFDDQDVRPEILTSGAAARERFRRVSDQWNAHLFVKVQSNTRDDPAYSRNAPQPPAASSDAQPNRWMHVKSGGIYDVLMTAKSEADSTLVTIYRGVESLIIWAQPTREFMDGRFVRVDAAIKGEQT